MSAESARVLREKRLRAAGEAFRQGGWLGCSEIERMMDAADEAVPIVFASWDGLLEILETHYPESVFTGESGDPGAHIIALTRAVERLATWIEQNVAGSQVYRASGLVVT